MKALHSQNVDILNWKFKFNKFVYVKAITQYYERQHVSIIV